MNLTAGNIITVAIVAYLSVWLIDKGLAVAGLSKYAVNSPS